MASRKFNDLGHFSLGNLECENPANTHTVPVDMQHDLHRIRFRTMKDALQNEDDEFHGGVVVVVQQHLVHLRLLELALGAAFGDDARFVVH